MGSRNTVEFSHVALRMAPEILDPVNVGLVVCKELGVIDPEVMKVRYVEDVVALPAIGIDDAVRDDFALDDRHQGFRRCIGNDLCVDLPTPLQQPENRDFPSRAPAPPALPFAAEIALVHFDLAAKHRFALSLHFEGDDLA